MDERIRAALRAAALELGGECVTAYQAYCRRPGEDAAALAREVAYLEEVGGTPAGAAAAQWWWCYAESSIHDVAPLSSAGAGMQNVKDGCDLTQPLPTDVAR